MKVLHTPCLSPQPETIIIKYKVYPPKKLKKERLWKNPSYMAVRSYLRFRAIHKRRSRTSMYRSEVSSSLSHLLLSCWPTVYACLSSSPKTGGCIPGKTNHFWKDSTAFEQSQSPRPVYTHGTPNPFLMFCCQEIVKINSMFSKISQTITSLSRKISMWILLILKNHWVNFTL